MVCPLLLFLPPDEEKPFVLLFDDGALNDDVDTYWYFSMSLLWCGVITALLFFIGAIFEFRLSVNNLEWNQTVWSGIWITGVLATFVAILIMVWAQKIVSPIQTAMIFTLEPVFAGIYNHFFTDHILSSWGIFAGFIIVLGIIYHEYSVN